MAGRTKYLHHWYVCFMFCIYKPRSVASVCLFDILDNLNFTYQICCATQSKFLDQQPADSLIKLQTSIFH